MLGVILIFLALMVFILDVDVVSSVVKFLKKFKTTAIRKGLKTEGNELKLMTQTCELCKTKFVYTSESDAPKFKVLTAFDENGIDVTKKCCESCYKEVMENITKDNSYQHVKVSDDLKRFVDMLKK